MPANQDDPGDPPAQDAPNAAGGWLNRNVWGMGLASLLTDASHEMATAVLPAFLAGIGAPIYALGLVEGVADGLSSFVKLGMGWWSDRVGRRKPLITTGYVLTAVSMACFAAATTWPLILLARIAGWFGRGFRSPLRNALLAESVSAQDRGKAFGFHRAGDTVGAIIGPLTAAALLHYLGPLLSGDPTRVYRIIFLLTLIPGLGAALAFVCLVRERRREHHPGIKFWGSFQALPTNFRRFLLGAGVFGAGDFSHTLLIAAAEIVLLGRYGVEAATLAALLYALHNVACAIAAYPVGALSDRLHSPTHMNPDGSGRRILLVLGYGLGALTAAGLAGILWFSVESLAALGLIFILAGIYAAVQDTLEGAIVADLVPEERTRGTAYGFLGAVNGVGDTFSSVMVGLFSSFSPAAGFAVAAGFMLTGAFLLHRVR